MVNTLLYIIIGFLLATIGSAAIGGVSDIISALCEWIKAGIGVQIVKCNVAIAKLNNSIEETHTRAIGFAITSEEEED